MGDSKASASVKIVEKWRRRSVADEITTCWICGRALVNPRSLPCLHSFCEDCLLMLLQTCETRGQLDRIFRCPQCKALVPNYIPEKVSRTWLRMFPSKRTMDNMKDAVNLIEEMCKPCSEKWKIVPASKFCVDCAVFYCVKCESDHKTANKRHKVVDYELKQLKNTPASNVSVFKCPQHKHLRFSTYCESHAQFLCNNCMESGQHLGCRTKNNIIEMVRSITKSEAKLHVINHLKHDERNIGKDHMKVIEQIEGLQKQLEDLKSRHTTLYCNYVMQATVNDHKTEAMDALKGKLEFDMNFRSPDPVSKTMTKVEAILSEFTSVFADATDDKAIRHDVHKSIHEIEKILNKEIHGDRKEANKDTVSAMDNSVESQSVHRCKRHVDVAMTEDDVILLSKAMASVGVINYSGMCGTAFRVGTKYVMTAAHVVRDIVDPERTMDSDWAALEDKNIFIAFSGSLEEPKEIFWFTSQVPFLNDQLGIAVLEIKEPKNLPPPLRVSTKIIPESEISQVILVGYRHIETLNKYVESGCDVIAPESERAMAAINWLKEEERKHRCALILSGNDHSLLNWNYDYMKDKARITVNMYADHRSFGTPVMVKSGSYGLKVVAILNETVPECFLDLPSQLQERFPPEFRFETGTKMNYIYDVIATESRNLADDLFLVDERL